MITEPLLCFFTSPHLTHLILAHDSQHCNVGARTFPLTRNSLASLITYKLWLCCSIVSVCNSLNRQHGSTIKQIIAESQRRWPEAVGETLWTRGGAGSNQLYAAEDSWQYEMS